MPKPRKKIPKLTEKQMYQEANNSCSLCPESDVAVLELHHIDEDPSNNAPSNLIVVCSSCHTKITKGLYSTADVITRKRELAWIHEVRQRNRNGVSISVNNSTVTGNITQNITKIHTDHAPIIAHPPGSIGANLAMNAYVDYLITRYYKYRKADKSYGRITRFSHSVIHKNIKDKFGQKTYFLPESRFPVLVEYLTALIDGTIQGQRNKSLGRHSYHSYESHCSEFKLI